MDFDTYQEEAHKYDYTKDTLISLMGLLGEVGEINSVLKKRYRDRRKDDDSLIEELGDTLWYISTICSHESLKLNDVANKNLHETDGASMTHICKEFSEYQRLVKNSSSNRGISSLSALSKNAASLFKLYTESNKGQRNPDEFKAQMVKEVGDVLWYLANIATLYDLKMNVIASNNLEKIRKIHDEGELSEFDKKFPPEESFPRQFVIKFCEIEQDGVKKVRICLDDEQLGNTIDDNAMNEDFYRYHDAFHLAYAAILGWSPVIRKFLKRKRKSDSKTDKIQDGARASFLEETVSLYVFLDAEKNDLYKECSSIDLSVLKNVKALTKNLEVSSCTYKQWNKAILEGYKVFRQLIKYREGIVELDLDEPSIYFKGFKE